MCKIDYLRYNIRNILNGLEYNIYLYKNIN